MAAYRFAGSQCRYRLLTDIDTGTLCRQAMPPPGPTGNFSLWPDLYDPEFVAALGLDSVITDADKAEFKLIEKMPALDFQSRRLKNVRQYVSFRTIYFGSPSVYAAFASESDVELATTEWKRKKRKPITLRSMIIFDGKMQQVFYRWVRKAYKNQFGDDVDVTEMIRKGMSKELEKKIQEVRGSIRVKKIHDEKFSAGGFNPRPMKLKGFYILGTLSDHATGMAVDIDDSKNAQLGAEDWKFVEKLVEKVPRGKDRWATEDDAEDFWSDVTDLSASFVAKVASEIERITKERAEKERKEKERTEKEKALAKPAESAHHEKAPPHPADAHHKKPARLLTPLQEVLGDHYKALSPWATSGFFHLPLELVLELHAHGFTWGAFFPNPDLHHFQLD